MKAHEDRFQPVSVAWKDGYSFIRKGEAGDHKALLTERQLARFLASLHESFPASALAFKQSYLE